ncbi:hypothetical protein R1flu_013625 [Riccia fluitans]|uniref:Uncharacterized protein n=1 Tax=Riccia fluitans TaxID=41844 RepID=A0ABD1YDS4_9MARC
MGRVGKILVGATIVTGVALIATRFAVPATIVTGVALLATPLAVPAVVSSLGFGPAGITEGSWAASFMASYGGTVAGGSFCATMQSIGAMGTFAGATAVAAAGAVLITGGAIVAARV